MNYKQWCNLMGFSENDTEAKAKFSENRRTGRTTLLADNAIQAIFNGEKWFAQNHSVAGIYSSGKYAAMNKQLFDLVIRRLRSEHNLDELYGSKKIRVNEKTLEIWLNI